MRRAAHSLVVLGVALSACPPPPQLEGTLCDPQGECPLGLICFHARCRAQACDPDELGNECRAGVGECSRPGVFECMAGEQRCSGVPGEPSPEICNGLDDDCDGDTDDSPLDAGEDCVGGLGVCRAAGVRACVDGGWACQTGGPAPVAEACNGLDDDCDGYDDDGCISTLAGNGPPGDRDGPWADAMLHRPAFAVGDGKGNVFFADSSNNKVKVIRPDGGIFTVAGNGACAVVEGPGATASFCQPWGVDLAANGDLYVTDIKNRRVRVVRNPLVVPVVETRFLDAGLTLNSPRGIHFTRDGGLLVTDQGASKVYVLTHRLVETIGGAAGLQEGGAGTVQFNLPIDAVEDDDGSIIVSESGSHRIRRVPRDGTTLSSVLAGGGDSGAAGQIADRVGADARFNTPQQLYLDLDAGRVLVLDNGNSAVRAVPLDGLTATRTLARLFAPQGPAGPSGFVAGSGPTGLARLDDTSFAVTEINSHWVRRVAMFPDGGSTVSNLVSASATEPHRDHTDPLQARMLSPDRLVSWPAHGLVWTDATTVRLMIPDAGRVATLAGPQLPGSDAGRDGPLFGGAWIGRPQDVKVGPDGALYFTDIDTDTVRRIDVGLTRLETFAGPDAGINVSFVNPTALAFGKAPDGEDLMFVADGVNNNSLFLRRFGLQSGSRAIVAGGDSGVPLDATGTLLAGANGDVYLADGDPYLRRLSLDGGVAQVYRFGNNNGVRGFAFDESGRLVWARTRRISRADVRDGGTEVLFESALYPDLQSIPGFADGPPRDAGILWNGSSVVLDGERIIVTDELNNRLRVVLMPH